MGLGEILGIVNLVGILAIVALLVMLLRKRGGLSVGQDGGIDSRELDDAAKYIIDDVRKKQEELRIAMQTELRESRKEINDLVQTAVRNLGDWLGKQQKESIDAQNARIDELRTSLEKRITDFTLAQDKRIGELITAEEKSATDLRTLLSERMDSMDTAIRRMIGDIEVKFREFREQNEKAMEALRTGTEERLREMQKGNEDQLEKMRATVDEKLQKTLDERITQSFKTVSDRLAEVYKGLGEMQALASSVGDLKSVLSGVKTRGIWGELQLGAIMQELLAPEQYEENVATVPNSNNRVEFAIRLPGDGDAPVYLPIDAKFPVDTYQQLLAAYETGNPEEVQAAQAHMVRVIKGCAKDIATKYVDPPHTTPFAIMFLPIEGLYAEVVRLGMIETLQQEYKISLVGPSTMAAFLNSLRMGFRTLAVQKRSVEVWQILGAVKTEFEKFAGVLKKAKDRIDQTGDELDKLIGVRTRAIERKLRGVEALPDSESARVVDSAEDEE